MIPKILRPATRHLLKGLLLVMLLCPPLMAAVPGEMGVDEHPGARIPLDVVLRDESGRPVRLGDLVTGPTIILPVYYRCSNVCSVLQTRMASALQQLEREPLRDYRVISFSFDDKEGADLAARSRRTYLAAIHRPFPEAGWRFLTGDAAAIGRLTDALGYRFQRERQEFAHPVVSIVVAGDGAIIRYLYGLSVLPKDLALALAEAKSGIAGISARRLMDFCFSYDPAGRGYVFNLLRVSGTVVLICAGGLLAFLFFGGKRRER